MLRAAVYAVLIKNEKILLAKRCNTKFFDGYYSIPGGHIDGDESAKEAMIREMKEEIGIEITKKNLELVHTLHRRRTAFDGELEYIDLFFGIKKWKNEPKNCELDKCDDLNWFNITRLPKNIIPHNKKIISYILRNQIYSEIGFE